MAPKPRRRTVTLTLDGLTSEEFYDGLLGFVGIIETVADLEDSAWLRSIVSIGSYNAAFTPSFERKARFLGAEALDPQAEERER